MRILHVIPYMHPRAGGPPLAVQKFVEEASGAGHLSEIISTKLFCDGDETVLLKQLNELAPTTFLPSCRPFVPLRRFARQQLAKSIRATHIVHVHTLWNPINVLVRLECARHLRPYVLMPHGMLDPNALMVRRWRKKAYFWALERKNLFAAERLIYTTPDEARLATTEFPSLPKGAIIPLGGDAPRGDFGDLASAFLENFPKARNRRRLLFLGRLHFKKGLDRILSVLPSLVDALPNVLLTVVGDGSPRFVRALEKRIAKEKLENNVLMTGRLDGALKWGAYAAAELFVLPSRQENFAITVAEAMHMGVPVIISDKVNTWRYVKEAAAGVVVGEAGIEDSLARCLLSLLRDTEARKMMGTCGQNYARQNLTWRSATVSLLKTYEEVLKTFKYSTSVNHPIFAERE
jgi:glycosyltransferase involved in cell wall biosynthesis